MIQPWNNSPPDEGWKTKTFYLKKLINSSPGKVNDSCRLQMLRLRVWINLYFLKHGVKFGRHINFNFELQESEVGTSLWHQRHLIDIFWICFCVHTSAHFSASTRRLHVQSGAIKQATCTYMHQLMAPIVLADHQRCHYHHHYHYRHHDHCHPNRHPPSSPHIGAHSLHRVQHAFLPSSIQHWRENQYSFRPLHRPTFWWSEWESSMTAANTMANRWK